MASTALVRSSDDRTIPMVYEGKIEPNYYCRGWNEKRKKYCGSRAGERTTHSGVGRCFRHGGQKRGGDARVTSGQRSLIHTPRIAELIAEEAKNENPLDVTPELHTARALMKDWINRYEENTAALLAWHRSWDGRTLPEDQKLALLACLDELEGFYREKEITSKQEQDLADARAAIAFLTAERAARPRQILDISQAVSHADVISKIIARVHQHQSQNAISFQRLSTFLFELSRMLDVLVPDRDQLARINAEILRIRI